MLEEGVAREVVNKVQKLRKKVGHSHHSLPLPSPHSPSALFSYPSHPHSLVMTVMQTSLPLPSYLLPPHTLPLKAGLKPTDPACVLYEAIPSEGDGSQTAAVELSDIIQRQTEYIAASIKLDFNRKQGEIHSKVLEKDTQKVCLVCCFITLMLSTGVERSMCWVY